MVIFGDAGYNISLPQLSDAEQNLRNDKGFEEISIAQIETSARYLENIHSRLGDKTYFEDLAGKDNPNFGIVWYDHVGHAKEPQDAFDEQPNTYIKPFNLPEFFNQADEYLKEISIRMTAYAHSDIRNVIDHQPLVDIVGCLEDSEWRYLPLWAGGCDDESGGVYEDSLPNMSAGFSHPGPDVHIGPDSTAASSEFDFIQGPNTHNTSTVTNGGSRDCAPSDVESGVFIKRDPSVFGDSEYDFGSFASVDDSTGEQEPSAISTANVDQPLSAKAQGKQRLHDWDNVETVFANLPRCGLEEPQRAKRLCVRKKIAELQGENGLYDLEEAESLSTAHQLSPVESTDREKAIKGQEKTSTADVTFGSLFPKVDDSDDEGGTVTGKDTDEESEACAETVWEFCNENIGELMILDAITDGEERGDMHGEEDDDSDTGSDFTLVGDPKALF